MRPDFFVDMGPDVSLSSLACPKCTNVEARILPFSEQLAVQHWFLRCAVCGNVWTIDKKLQTLANQQIHQQSHSPRKFSTHHQARARKSHYS
jgi:uncharacterized Zn finger protein